MMRRRLCGWKLRRLRRRLWREGAACWWCRCPLTFATATLDHVVPLSQGGDMGVGNIVLACWECNHRRGEESDPMRKLEDAA
jgi:5-methylcytosine-specific restriction endonuclease McrA